MAYSRPSRKPKRATAGKARTDKADLTSRYYDKRVYEGMTDAEIEARYYRLHTYADKGPSRREQREYLETKNRLLPCPPKETPTSRPSIATEEIMSKVFRTPNSKVKRAARAAIKEMKRQERIRVQRENALPNTATAKSSVEFASKSILQAEDESILNELEQQANEPVNRSNR